MKWFSAAIVSAISLFAGSAASQAKDIVQTARDAGQFTLLLQAVEKAGLETKLATPGPFTVFAPTDDAFRALPPDVAERLMDPQNKDELASVLSYHVLAGRLASTDFAAVMSDVQTLAGRSIFLTKEGETISVNGATLTQSDIVADNGVVHVIDKVLLPPQRLQPTFKSKD